MASFEDLVSESVLAACLEFGYPEPDGPWYQELNERLPSGLGILFVRGRDSQLLRVDGFRFTMRDLPDGKGPCALDSER